MTTRLTLADCPYKAGTEEANHWIKTEYIRSEQANGRQQEDRERYGAPSIGAEIIEPPNTSAPVRLVHNPETGLLRMASADEPAELVGNVKGSLILSVRPQTIEEIIAEILA